MLHPIPDCGDHMTLEIFLQCVREGSITDEDGIGSYATIDRMSDVAAVPSDMWCGIIENYTHVVWFSR